MYPRSHRLIGFQDAFDLFTGAWVADHQSLSSAIITDTRPLVLRSVRVFLCSPVDGA